MDLETLAKQIESLSGTVSNLKETIVQEVSTSILSEVDKKNQGLAANLNRDFKKYNEEQKELFQQQQQSNNQKVPTQERQETEESKKSNNTLKALQKQIDELKSQNKAKDNELANRMRDSQLSQIFSSRKSPYPERARKAFLMEFGDKVVAENGNYYLQESEEDVIELDKAVDGFLETDFGSTFLPPSRKKGLGIRSSNGATANTKSDMSLNEAILMEN